MKKYYDKIKIAVIRLMGQRKEKKNKLNKKKYKEYENDAKK